MGQLLLTGTRFDIRHTNVHDPGLCDTGVRYSVLRDPCVWNRRLRTPTDLPKLRLIHEPVHQQLPTNIQPHQLRSTNSGLLVAGSQPTDPVVPASIRPGNHDIFGRIHASQQLRQRSMYSIIRHVLRRKLRFLIQPHAIDVRPV